MTIKQQDRDWLNREYEALLSWREDLTDSEIEKIHLALSKLLSTHIAYNDKEWDFADNTLESALRGNYED